MPTSKQTFYQELVKRKGSQPLWLLVHQLWRHSQNQACELSVNESETYKLDFPWNTHGLKGKELGKSNLTIFSKTSLICTNDQETHWELLNICEDVSMRTNTKTGERMRRYGGRVGGENQSSSIKQTYFLVQWRMYLNGYWNETQ